ncbi:PREDICTED: protein KRBA1 [Condylura cristata]|uniref:protein KRBA1 n=1 Tax=Condylura cristata TaxID=143302 RepID=UPI000642E7E3|nr:PREDICTED: protein KRBA1 [Condylura cristata]
MRENYETLVSLGTDELLPLSAFLCPTELGGAVGGRSRTDAGPEPPRGAGPPGAAPQHSLHLNALVQLVREIPEFLFGGVSPDCGGAGLDGEQASPQAAMALDAGHLGGLIGGLPDTPSSGPSLASTPSGSSLSSDPPGARGQGSPLPIKTAGRPWPTEREGPGALGGERGPSSRSPSPRTTPRKQEGGAAGSGAAGVSPGRSPLQGLINCLKEILVPGPQLPAGPPPAPGLGASRLTRAPGGPPWGVKTEASASDCPLQGLLSCLKEIPEAPDRRPPGPGGAPPQEGGTRKGHPGGSRPPQAPSSGPGAGRALPVVKTEDVWAQSPPVPTPCQLSNWTHSPAALSSPGGAGGNRGVPAPSWGPSAQAGSASRSPLEALEACLKGIPLSGSLPPQPPATSWFRSPQPGTPGSPRPELQPRGSHGEEVAVGPRLAPVWAVPRALHGKQAQCRVPPPWPAALDAAQATGKTPRSSETEPDPPQTPLLFFPGSPVGSSPLQGLENCLREIPMARPRPAWPWSSSGDGGPQRTEPSNGTTDKEGPRGEACEPAPLGQHIGGRPGRSLQPASPPALTPCSLPSGSPRGLKDHRPPGPPSGRALRDGLAGRPSPLRCLESSLRVILPGRPLRFACLAGPSPSPGSSSSLSSSDGDELRPESEPWPLPPPGTAGDPFPTPGLGKGPDPEPCQPPSLAPRPLSWKPEASKDPGCLGPGRTTLSVAVTPGCLGLLAGGFAELSRADRPPLPQRHHSGSVPASSFCPASSPFSHWKSVGADRGQRQGGAQAEGCRAGDPSGPSSGGPRLVPPLPEDAPPAEASGSDASPSPQRLPAACSCAVLTVHPLPGHAGGQQGPPPPSVPAALPPQAAAPAARADGELLPTAPARTLDQPREPGSLWVGVQRALEGEPWGREPRDARWGAPGRLFHLLGPVGDARPPASPKGRLAPSPGQTCPLSGP